MIVAAPPSSPEPMSDLTKAFKRIERSFGVLTSAERERLDFIIDAGLRNKTVPDERELPLPADPGKLAFSIEWDEASLNWNATWATCQMLMAQAKRALVYAKGSEREAAREFILTAFRNNHHRDHRVATACAAFTTWLIFTNPAGGDALRSMAELGELDHAGYVITMKEDGEYNFRLIAGRRGS